MVDCDDVVQQVGLDAANRTLATLQTFLWQRQENAFCEVKNIRSLQNKVSMWRVKGSRHTAIDSYFVLALLI